ncbi:glutamate racemase [Methylocapsa polymorpha]|uniref:Glutamate racemase n=1 Tax=Methylocapsa polymorpha TaxID=3080828 RepID=A0ABZ0HRQ7_9HYPH|nr:glutamate racemase [Methylocapsa sp. RX1]
MSHAPKILVFDSGLGGLTVFAEVARVRPDAHLIYAADDAGFPYGDLGEKVLVARVLSVLQRLIARVAPDAVVIACNTASTLVLPHLRAQFPQLPFVGTVPAIKPAASQSRSQLISVLATPGTVARDYTRDLVRAYAAHCMVTLVGSSALAGLAEAFVQGESVSDAAILREIAPAFVANGEGRTDCIVLACTHYPLLIEQLERLAPWPVQWIDPAPAIARRTDHVLCEDLGFLPPKTKSRHVAPHHALFTGASAPAPKLSEALRLRGIGKIELEPMPLVFA